MCEWDEILYRGLQEANLLYCSQDAVAYSTSMEYYEYLLQDSNWYRCLDSEIKRHYSLMLKMNCMKFYLAAKNFQKAVVPETVSAAVGFVLAGCLLDNMIDEGTPQQRDFALSKLDWSYCEDYFVRFESAKSSHIVDIIYEEIGSFLRQQHQTNALRYQKLIQYIQRAIAAEQIAASDRKTAGNQQEILDKSILFVVVGFQLALSDYTDADLETFFLIGNIFRLIDDLCDMEQDERNKQGNSLLCASNPIARGSEGILALVCAMERLKTLVDCEFYSFILYEVRYWTLSNSYIYHKTIISL